MGKPAPAIYRLACSKLDVSPNSAVAIEDAFSGVQAAKAAGLRCVAVPGNQDPVRLLSAGADLMIKDFRGLTLTDLERAFRGEHGTAHAYPKCNGLLFQTRD